VKSFANLNPKDVGEAVNFLGEARQRGKKASLVSGGSDLLGMIKEDLVSPDLLVDLKGVAGLDEIQEQGSGVRIGGLVTLDALSRHSLIRSRYPVLAEAAESVGTPQIRNTGTLAGNLCQRPWCWYLREGFPCLKNGGNMCYSVVGENQFNAIFGRGPSFIVHPSDTAPALIALNARFRIVGPQGEREVPASEFFILPSEDVLRENVLEPGEVLVEVQLPEISGESKSSYVKIMDREAWTHAVVSAAIVLEISQGLCKDARIVLGGVAPIPWRVPRAERILAGKRLTPDLAVEVGKAAVSGARPLSKNGYKVPLTQGLVRRTLMAMAGQDA
jgi:xanthine dehydrogenase YagS FAD-binding subunit